ncbi:MAG: tRNA (adenosine(37)-N6)-threonylcarbamoyltransferase complex transferase subunit TsaD [Candidatus Micrarchaeota archaeon]|nr:tRNA (adenosine(37)-N6)-threonylcarbamoyltransferase complex transferase subunit TsaD [Candidatus Micrarchaeota archaeon]
MATLGIESSAHTFGVGIVERGRVLANAKSMYPITDKGMIPAKVADHHIQTFKETIEQALYDSGLSMSDIDSVGYTRGPGLGPCLRVGQLAARTISERRSIPIFPVNHACAHIEITRRMAGLRSPLALYVSGGNSQIVAREKHGYHVLGETLDIGVGNMLDNFARSAKMVPAWGSSVAKSAIKGRYLPMPYTVKGMDFAFTGLLTSAAKMLGRHSVNDISHSLQETAFSMLCEATERALLLTRSRELAVCGGVAQSSRLREMLSIMSRPHGIRFGFVDDQYNSDNGAMIAYVAELMRDSGSSFQLDKCTIDQKYRIEEVEALWR